MSRESIIERIKKLLAMTEKAGCTQAEAIQAALMAQKLIADHDVSSSELHETTADEPVVHLSSSAASRYRDWGKALAVAVADAFRCKSYGNRSGASRYLRPCFVGHVSDAKAAALVFDRLYAVGCKLGDGERQRARDRVKKVCDDADAPTRQTKHWAREEGARAYDSFTWGFYEGVKAELEKQSVALVIVTPSDVKAEFESMCTTSRKASTGRAAKGDSYSRGKDAGRDAVRAGRVGDGGSRHLLAS